ncbi:hypothetical protein DFQ28_007909 [Apophysomyces sp. BC1034]|nr:hypothetical protein DFQ30_007404 [Apophysomyces sp. BC1015]KAG0186413.1 hypothetical protein DFQ28_007909 [Apophysomyces sp. BC1034]
MSIEWRQYVVIRRRFLKHLSNKTASKTLLICNLPEHIRSDEELKSWLEDLNLIQYPIRQALIGRYNTQISRLMPEYEDTVRRLENTLASYLSGNPTSLLYLCAMFIVLNLDGKRVSPKRPVKRIGGFLGFIRSEKVDAIDYYTKRIIALENKIKKLRRNKSKPANYGWITFSRIDWAYKSKKLLQESEQTTISVKTAPLPKDVLWHNLPIDAKTRRLKRWYGWGLFWSLMFIWLGPISVLSAMSNIVNVIRLIPGSKTVLSDHSFAMCLVQGYFTPILMALFFYTLPCLFRYIGRNQAYHSETTLEQKVLVKLYLFFILINFVAFTVTSMFIGIFGQTSSLITEGALSGHELPQHIAQIAKNISDVSAFWINYVCIKSAGATLEMAQVLPLIALALKQLVKRLSPRKLRQLTRPPTFDYPRNYNILLFFFTIALVYSTMAPLVLPFALLYFVLATTVYKYMLMYIYVTKVESNGRMWPVLFHTIIAALFLFQVVMFVMLQLKSGHSHSYFLAPLPFLTLIYQYFHSRRMRSAHPLANSTELDHCTSYVSSPSLSSSEKSIAHHLTGDRSSTFIQLYSDPALHSKLLRPMVHDDVKHLLLQVYRHQMQQNGGSIDDQQHQPNTDPQEHTPDPLDLNYRHDCVPTNPNYHNPSQTTVLLNDRQSIQFYTVSSSDIQEIRDDNDDDDENDLDDDPYWPSAPPMYIFPTLEDAPNHSRNFNTMPNERSIRPASPHQPSPSAPVAEEIVAKTKHTSNENHVQPRAELPPYEESAQPCHQVMLSATRQTQPRRSSAPASYP